VLDETDKEILARILSRVPSGLIDVQEGSIISDVLSPTALELAQQRSMFKYMLGQAFVNSSSGEYLDFGAGDQGLTRALGEGDEDFRARALYLKRNPEKGGANSDYERWALTISGVQYARSIDKARGLGTVDIVISGLPSELDQLVIDVQALIDLKKTSGLDVVVRKVNVLQVEFSILWAGMMSEESARSTAEEYIRSVGVGGTVRLAGIVYALMNAGCTDVVIESPGQNIVLPIDSIVDPVVILT